MGITAGSTRARPLKLIAGLAVIALLAAGCGGSSASAGAEDANGTVDIVMAPDPVWKWLRDQGIKQEMEDKAGVRVKPSTSWDEFGAFAGGHADVISAASYEVPDLEEAAGEPLTIFGKYNADRSVLAVGANSPYQNLCDLEGKKIATYTAVSITLIWGVYAEEFCGLDLRAGGGDFEVIVTDVQNMASLVTRGDADACLCLPDFAIPGLSSGQLRPLYDGKSVAELYAERFSSDPETMTHPQTNVFVARKAWVEKNPEEAQFLVELWDRGLQEWKKHRDEIIDAYPEDFVVRNQQESQFIKGWLTNQFNWFAPTAYLDEEWVAEETGLFKLMKETGFMEEDVAAPHFTVFEPTAQTGE